MAIKLTKEPIEVLKYKVKLPLPGGIEKDDIVEYDPKTKKYTHITGKGLRMDLPWDCKKETKFFTLIKDPIYQPGKFVYVTKAGYYPTKSTRGNTVHVNAFDDMCVISTDDKGIALLQLQSGITVLIDENKLLPSTFWMFYNSDGQLQKLSSKKHPTKQKFCKSIGNYFTTPEEATEWLKKVQKFKVD